MQDANIQAALHQAMSIYNVDDWAPSYVWQAMFKDDSLNIGSSSIISTIVGGYIQ